MIRIFKLWKQYGDAPPVLMDVSLHVDRGEFVFLTGPSGSGKTTLLRILVGEERPSAGQVVLGGKDVGSMPESKIPYLRRSVGFVFQDFKLLPNKTAFENAAIVLKISGLTPGEQRLRAVKALRRVGLEHRMHYYPAMLSGGEQQRVAIARAVVNDPELLLADEPTGNLDPDLSLEIMNIFREINARGTTVVVATHDPALIDEVKRRVIVLGASRGIRVLEVPGQEGDPTEIPGHEGASAGRGISGIGSRTDAGSATSGIGSKADAGSGTSGIGTRADAGSLAQEPVEPDAGASARSGEPAGRIRR